MRSLIRLLLVATVGLLLGLPVLGDETTGGGGDSGVWILPRSASQVALQLSGGGVVNAARGSRIVPLNAGLVMQMPPEMSAPIAILREVPSNLVLATTVAGNLVTLPCRTVSAIASGMSSGRAEGVMVDASGLGFRLVLTRQPNGSVLAEIY